MSIEIQWFQGFPSYQLEDGFLLSVALRRIDAIQMESSKIWLIWIGLTALLLLLFLLLLCLLFCLELLPEPGSCSSKLKAEWADW